MQGYFIATGGNGEYYYFYATGSNGEYYYTPSGVFKHKE